MENSLYVITHKEIKNIFPKDRKIMMVGAFNKQVPNDYYSDYNKEKDNISNKNSNYCELTGLYYMIKYDNADIIGLEHYRRLFIKSKLYLFKYPFLTDKYITKLMQKYDLVMPKKAKLKMSVYEQYKKEHYSEDLDKIEKILINKYPEYIESYESFMKSNQIYFYNMFVGKRQIIVDYANWLFDILFDLEKQIDISDRDNYQKRVFGFLSERLFNVWLGYHKEIKIVERPVQLVEENAFKSQINRIVKKIFKRS